MKNLLYITVQDPYPCKDGGNIENFFPAKYFTKYFNVNFAFCVEEIKENTISKYIEYNLNPYPYILNKKDNYLKYPLSLITELPFKMHKYYNKNVLSKLSKIVNEQNIDIIWASSPHSAKYAIQLKNKFSHLKIYLREHNMEFDLVKQYSKEQKNIFMKIINYFEYLKTKKYEISLWNKFDKVFFISDSDLEEASKYNNKFNETNLIYSGMEKYLINNNDVEPKSFIFTGSLSTFQNKSNLSYFIKNIWMKFHNKVPDAKLYITGNKDEDLCIKLNMSLEELNSLKIFNLGFVDNIKSTIASKKYLVSPTLRGSGIRLKVLEGLSLHKCVFVSDIDYRMAKCFKDMENIVHYNNFQTFYEKYLILEQNPQKYSSITMNGNNLIENIFNWDLYVKKAIKEMSCTIL